MAGYPGYAGYGGDVEMGKPPPGGAWGAGAPPPPGMAYAPPQPGGTYAPPQVQTAPPVQAAGGGGGSRPGAGGRPPVPNAVATASQAARLGFIRKVYCILSLQLALTFGLVSIFTFVPDVRFWVLDYQDGGGVWFPWTAMGLAFGFFVVLVCCGEMARRHPWNMILLLLFTAFEGVFLGSIAARYACNAPSSVLYTCPPFSSELSKCTLNRDMCNQEDAGLAGGYLVLIAIGATVVLVLGLTLFACQTKFDFTGAAPYIFVRPPPPRPVIPPPAPASPARLPFPVRWCLYSLPWGLTNLRARALGTSFRSR